ncbi:hypothetical protein B566_EDAN008832 [Ephemera danica]|nr:hypothetical protein B566_EDAN008832 [Ephemera danica]
MSRWFALVALHAAFLCCSLVVGEINTAIPIDLQLLSENKVSGNYRPVSSSEENYVDSGSLPFYDSGMSCCRNVTALLGNMQMRLNTIGHKLDEEYYVLMDEGVLIDEMLEIINENNDDLREEETSISSLSTLAKYVSSAWLALIRALVTLNSNLEADD